MPAQSAAVRRRRGHRDAGPAGPPDGTEPPSVRFDLKPHGAFCRGTQTAAPPGHSSSREASGDSGAVPRPLRPCRCIYHDTVPERRKGWIALCSCPCRCRPGYTAARRGTPAWTHLSEYPRHPSHTETRPRPIIGSDCSSVRQQAAVGSGSMYVLLPNPSADFCPR